MSDYKHKVSHDMFNEKPSSVGKEWSAFIKEIEKKDIEELAKRLAVIRMGEKEDDKKALL